MLATTSVARASAIGLETLEELENLGPLEELGPLEKLVLLQKISHFRWRISHFLKERSLKSGEMCLFCAKKWLTLGCFTEKTYICSDK